MYNIAQMVAGKRLSLREIQDHVKSTRNMGLPLLALGLAILTVACCLLAHGEPRLPGDLRLTLLVQAHHGPALDLVMQWVSRLSGGLTWYIVPPILAGGIVVWLVLGRFEAALVVACGPISLLNSALKLAVDRPRPAPDLVRVVGTAGQSSFPSGHAFLAILFWGFLGYLACTHLKARHLKALALLVSAAMLLLVGVSRVYLGAHWPSDVLGGYVTGSLFLVILVWLERRRSSKRRSAPETAKAG